MTACYITCCKLKSTQEPSKFMQSIPSPFPPRFSQRQQHIFPLLRKVNLLCEEYHFEGLFPYLRSLCILLKWNFFFALSFSTIFSALNLLRKKKQAKATSWKVKKKQQKKCSEEPWACVCYRNENRHAY